MAYIAPYIDESGLHLPSYIDTRDELISRMRAIFGEDIYIGADSMDYQFVSVLSEKIADTHNAVKLAYNNRNPATAEGSGLFGLGRLNGIRRKTAGYSTVMLYISGVQGTVITGGIASTSSGQLWDFNDTVVIPASGNIEILATCRQSGKIFADIGTITRIMTPTLGWVSVTNNMPALPGKDIESSAEFRARQMISVAQPSRTVLKGTYGTIMALDNVTRAKVYENKSNIPDNNGIPGHSICAVVEGGNSEDIGNAIYYHKTPGCGTYGDIDILVTSEMQDGSLNVPPISFFRPSYVDAIVKIELTALSGYTEQTTADIILSVKEYLSALEIGADVILSAVYAPIVSATPDIHNPTFSVSNIQIGRNLAGMQTSDLIIAFNEVTRGIEDNVIVEVN